MSLVLYALDRQDADRTGARLIVHAPGWQTATAADLAPYLTVLHRQDAIETLAPAIENMRETAAAEASELERWLRAGGSRYVGFELDATLDGVVARSAIREPAIVLGTPLRPGDEEPISDTAIMHGACSGELLAIARWNGTVEVWSLPDRRRRAAFSPSPSAEDTENLIDGLAFDHELGILATSAHHGEEIAGFKVDGKRLWKRKVSNGNRGHLAFANGRLLWWCLDRAAVLDPGRGKPVFEIESDDELGGIIAAAIDDTSVVVAFHHGFVRRYPVAGGAPLREIRVALPQHLVLTGERMVIASRDDVIVVEPDGTSRSVKLDREALPAATGWTELASSEWNHGIESIAVLPDGAVAVGASIGVGGSWLGVVSVLDPASGNVALLGGPGGRHCHRLLEVLATPDGGVLSRDVDAIRLWDPKSGALRATFSGGTRKLAGMCLAHGHLWAWSGDGAIYGWELSGY